MRVIQLVTASLAASTASAWSWDSLSSLDIGSHFDSFIARRQVEDDTTKVQNFAKFVAKMAEAQAQQSSASSNTDSSASSGSQTVTIISSSASGSSGSSSNTNSAASSGSSNGNSTDTASITSMGSSTASSLVPQNTSTVDIEPQDPPGGIQMIMPNPTLGSQYYKVGDVITFQWNYTSLLITPTAIDILASVTAADGSNPSPFTLAVNQSVQATQTFTWDSGNYNSETSALPIGTYTLVVYDADSTAGASAIPSAGYLAAYNQFRFGMYTPRVDADSTGTALDYKCATCNAASSLERLTIGCLVGVAAITVTTFTIFSSGWGAFA